MHECLVIFHGIWYKWKYWQYLWGDLTPLRLSLYITISTKNFLTWWLHSQTPIWSPYFPIGHSGPRHPLNPHGHALKGTLSQPISFFSDVILCLQRLFYILVSSFDYYSGITFFCKCKPNFLILTCKGCTRDEKVYFRSLQAKLTL